MVMEAISPQSVGREFVRQYYTLLNKAPLHLHRFYSGDSSFVHGGLDKGDKMLEPVHGQQEIHKKIMQLNFRDCKAKIRQVDAHATLASGVVVQVLGELSNNHQPMRRFMQTFVLAPQTPKKYYVYNDIFRYQDEVFTDLGDQDLGGSNDNSYEAPNIIENEKNFHHGPSTSPQNLPNDGIATVSIIDGVKEPHLNGGGKLEGALSVNELSPRVPVDVTPTPVVDDSMDEPPEDPEEDPAIPAPIPVVPAPVAVKEVEDEPMTPTSAIAPAEVIEDPKVPPQQPEVMTPQSPATSLTPTPVASVAPVMTSEVNEKPTYANLFKKGGGAGPMVASGPLSLPPAGFNKAASTASSQPTSSSSLTLSPPAASATSAPGSAGSTPGVAGQQQQQGSGAGQGHGLKEGSPANAAGFQGGKPFRGGDRGGRSGGRGGGFSGGNPPASRDRYHPSRESVSSALGDENERADRGRSSRIGMNVLSNYPDSYQVFVGNLPHHCQERELEELFSKFGKVVEVRINTKGVAQSKNLPENSQKSVPNFGFVVFEDEKAASECLAHKPIHLTNGHRLNIETKKKNFQNRDDGKGAFGSSGGGANRGQGSGSNFDRGSQEQLGGLGRGGLNANSGRGSSRGGSRGGRGGFSGGRGGGGPPLQGGPGGGAGIPGAGNSQRTTYTRRS